jgi:hypothetical protein
MTKEQLRSLAQNAIDRWQSSNLASLKGDPKFQVRSLNQINFPFSFELLGKHKGMYVYVLNAKEIIQNLVGVASALPNRYNLEFEI